MSLFAIESLLFDLGQRPELREQFQQDLDGLLGGYALSSDESDAVRNLNLKWLYEHGVNPMLLLRFNLTGQIPSREAYTKLLTEGVSRT